MYTNRWEDIGEYVTRLKVPGGWLVREITINSSPAMICFYPDPEYLWIIND